MIFEEKYFIDKDDSDISDNDEPSTSKKNSKIK